MKKKSILVFPKDCQYLDKDGVCTVSCKQISDDRIYRCCYNCAQDNCRTRCNHSTKAMELVDLCPKEE